MTDFHLLKILIVDKNAFIAKTLDSILEAFDVRSISICNTLKEAEKEYLETTIDCIFIDFMMDNRSGLDLVKKIRSGSSSKNASDIPIILFTGVTDLKTVTKARDAGVTEIIGKPFAPDQVLLKFDNAINNKRDFIEGDEYIGPNRRRHKENNTNWKDDNERRLSEPDNDAETE